MSRLWRWVITKKASEKANIRRIFFQFIKRKYKNEYVVISENWDETRRRFVFLIQIESNPKSWLVEVRGPQGDSISSTQKPFSDLKSAQEKYKESVESRTKTRLQVIDNHYPEAKSFILKYERYGDNGDYSGYASLKTFQFMLAVYELLSYGFDYSDENGSIRKFPGTRTFSSRYFQEQKAAHREIARKHDNFIVILANVPKLKNILNKEVEDRPKAFQTLVSKFYRILDSLKMVSSKYHLIYTDFNSMVTPLKEHFKEFTRNNKKTEIRPLGTVLEEESHPLILINDLEKILYHAFQYSIPTFNFIILELSTALRPTEVRRLANDPEKFIVKDNFRDTLDYKGGKLIQKTAHKINPASLINPSLSLISRILLKYNYPLADQSTVEDFFNAERNFRKKDSSLQKFYERSLRTTAGHHIAYCESADDPHRASLHIVKERMGHATITMATNVYSKDSPASGVKPEIYFGLTGVRKDGVMYSSHHSLWDAWLLGKWLKVMEANLTKSDMDIIWNQIRTEYDLLLRKVAPSGTEVKPLDF